MSIESRILLSNLSTESPDLSIYSYSDKGLGSGYHQNKDALHTFQFILDNFKGSIKIQATLESYPGENSWVDVSYDSGSVLENLDSSPATSTASRNITGNWVWFRVAYIIEEGTISQIRYKF